MDTAPVEVQVSFHCYNHKCASKGNCIPYQCQYIHPKPEDAPTFHPEIHQYMEWVPDRKNGRPGGPGRYVMSWRCFSAKTLCKKKKGD